MQSNILKCLVFVAASGALACADSTSPGASRPVTVSFTTAAGGGASFSRATVPTASHDVGATVGTDALVITKAQLVVARMELQQAGATCTSTAASGDDDEGERSHECADLQVAPTLVDLPVNGTVVSALGISIPAGSYSALEAKIRPLRLDSDHGHGSAAFLAAHPDLAGVDVVVDGTFNGTPFSYRGAVRAELEHRFDPPLVVDAAPVNVTVNVDLANWFRTSTGALIDPTTANAGGPNAELVAQNIRRSLHAFRDDNRDGHDDEHHD